MKMQTQADIEDVVHRASYLAKVRTKVLGDGERNISISR